MMEISFVGFENTKKVKNHKTPKSKQKTQTNEKKSLVRQEHRRKLWNA